MLCNLYLKKTVRDQERKLLFIFRREIQLHFLDAKHQGKEINREQQENQNTKHANLKYIHKEAGILFSIQDKETRNRKYKRNYGDNDQFFLGSHRSRFERKCTKNCTIFIG